MCICALVCVCVPDVQEAADTEWSCAQRRRRRVGLVVHVQSLDPLLPIADRRRRCCCRGSTTSRLSSPPPAQTVKWSLLEDELWVPQSNLRQHGLVLSPPPVLMPGLFALLATAP